MGKFVHLHCHSEYSLLDGLPKIEKLINCSKKLGMEAVALTDHGVMHGAVEFYKAAKSENIKPIIGMEGYITPLSHHKKDGREGQDNFHITLLAKNLQGYKNLMKLTSIAHLEGYYYRPRVDKETLLKFKEGIICLSGCPKGELASAIKEDDEKKVSGVLSWYVEAFGEDFYLEVQRHEYDKFSLGEGLDPKVRTNLEEMSRFEKKWNEKIISMSRKNGIPIVATNDVHYPEAGDAFAQDVLVCISTGKNVEEVNRMRYVDTPTFYMRSEEEMQMLFPDMREALENSLLISQKCEVEISLGKWFFPEFELDPGKTADETLREKVYKKLPLKFPQTGEEINERVEYELSVISQKGYSAYFLIVEDFMGWANKKGVITNTRGSAAGSLVSYIMGITTVDPITYYLPFERFLNPYRPSPPDIDFDVADNRREEIIQYLVDKYGKDKVAQICTFGRMLARAAVRDVARVLGYPYAVGDRISKSIPLGIQGFPMTIARALKESPELSSIYGSDADAKRIIDTAKTIEGNSRHLSVHAAGVVVAPTELTDFTPLMLDPTGQQKSITQYEMHACEDVGLIKFDILGIRNLSILGAAVEIVEREGDKKIDLAKLPLDDKKTFNMLARGETMGTFQLGGSGITRYLKDLKPTRVEDLMAMVALFRPGPMAVIPEYISRKHNSKLVKFLDPRMEKYLDKSYGLLVYQDDLLFTAIELAGYTWEEADKFRKAVGKKIPSEMAKQKEKFKNGVVKNGRDEEFAETLWKLFEPFQAYGFNKAHAASYGLVAYQTAYMKANFPVEVMCALLTAESADAEKISLGVTECRRIGIMVEPPDINKSDVGFSLEHNQNSLEGRAIRFGLSAIKNVGEAAIGNILAARKAGDFKSLGHFCNSIDSQKVNRKVLESLIRAGALDRFGKRSSMLAGLDKIRNKADRKLRDLALGQKNLFEEGEEGGGIDTYDDLPDMEEFPKQELLASEKELLGFYLSEHPLSALSVKLSELSTFRIGEINPENDMGQLVRIGGVVSQIRILLTKKDSREMAFGRIEDLSGSIEVVVFPKVFGAAKEIFARDKAVLVVGKVDFREDQLSVLAERIYSLDEVDPADFESVPPGSGRTAAREYEFVIPKGTPSAVMLKLSKLFQESPGKHRVVLLFERGSSGFKKMAVPFGVNVSTELRKQVISLLGEDFVVKSGGG